MDGRIRTSILPDTATGTQYVDEGPRDCMPLLAGRLVSRRPNLQNQPALSRDFLQIRRAFVPAPGQSVLALHTPHVFKSRPHR